MNPRGEVKGQSHIISSLPALCNPSQRTFSHPFWRVNSDADIFISSQTKKDVKASQTMWYIDPSICFKDAAVPLFLLLLLPLSLTELLNTCLTGMWQTQLAPISLTNSVTPRRGGRKLLCSACDGKSLFIQLFVRFWAILKSVPMPS